MQVRVFVTPRKGILDPQGRAVESSLKSLGFTNVSDVKVGKYITLEIEARNAVRGARRSEEDVRGAARQSGDRGLPLRGRRRMKWGVVRFPGSLDDSDALYALADVMGQDARDPVAQGRIARRRRMRPAAGRVQLRRLPAHAARSRASRRS